MCKTPSPFTVRAPVCMLVCQSVCLFVCVGLQRTAITKLYWKTMFTMEIKHMICQISQKRNRSVASTGLRKSLEISYKVSLFNTDGKQGNTVCNPKREALFNENTMLYLLLYPVFIRRRYIWQTTNSRARGAAVVYCLTLTPSVWMEEGGSTDNNTGRGGLFRARWRNMCCLNTTNMSSIVCVGPCLHQTEWENFVYVFC